MSIRRNRRWLWALLCIAALLTALGLLLSKYGLQVSTYTLQTDSVQGVTIAHLTDLHNAEFGEGNTRLIQKIREQTPDLIVISGDLIDLEEDDLSIAVDLLTQLVQIAPVYCSYGNHEIAYEARTGISLQEIYEQTGVTVLKEAYSDVEINDARLRIGGIYGYCLSERYQEGDGISDELRFLREFENTDRYKILLSHLPYPWVNYGLSADYDIDLVFSGHIHGGQVRLPLIGGLYEPECGWFPGKCAGVYEEYGTTTVLSRGLGSAGEYLPRFHNIPEIVIVKLQSDTD